MIFFLRLIKAQMLKSKLKNYIETRKYSMKEEQRKHTWFSKYRDWCKKKCPCCFKSSAEVKISYSRYEKFRINLFTQGTYENYVLKSIVGFLSGVLLTYLFFIFFILQLNFPLGSATTMCSIFGLVLSLGLAYSYKVRCIVFLLLPQFFSKRGRQALVAYAFILALTGPAKNTLHNMRVLSETMACGQGKLKAAVKSLIDLIKKPFYAIKDSMKQIMEKVKVVVEKVKEIIITLKRIVKSIIGVIKAAYEWLNSVVSMCGKKLGTPFERCGRAFDKAYDSCIESVPSLFQFACKVTDFVQGVCYIVKPIDFICELFEFVSDEIVTFVKRKLGEFSSQVKNIFYISVKFSHNFEFHTEQSKTVKEIAANIMMEVKQRSEKIVYFFDWMSFVFSFFFLYMLFQVLNYKRKYMTNEWFDNHFITDNIVHLDIQRTRQGMETILPLNVHEKKKYVYVSSIRLVKNEKRALAKSAVFLGLSTVKLSIHMLTDYSLWWVLQMIRRHGQFQTNVDTPTNVKVLVEGKGMLADLYSSILNTFQPSGVKFDLDTTPCLPDPTPPDIPRYKQIASLIVLAWILSICEPYGLRLRNSAMGYYYPARARVRAVWLYNHILRSRGSFLKYARRQLRRMFIKDGQGVEKISFMDRLVAVCPILRKIYKGKPLEACLLCGGLGSSSLPLVKCPRPDCIGVYCVPCYGQLQNICTLCKLPIEYGDLSDMSEERDSSEVMSLLNTEDVSSTGESNTTGAILEDTAESDVSFGYQFKDRDVGKDKDLTTSGFKDVEAQKSLTKASIDDFAYPIEHHPEENEHKLTLSQRRKSGLWSIIADADDKKKKPKFTDLSALSLEEIQEHQGEEAGGKQLKGQVSTPASPRLSKVQKIKKLLHLPQLKGFKKKIGKIEKSGDESDVKSFPSTPSKTSEGSKKSKKKVEGSRIRHLKKKLFGKGAGWFKKAGTDKDGSEEISLPTVMSKVSKSSEMVANWVKTGKYHGFEVLQSMQPEFNIPSLPTSETKQPTGFLNLFKHLFSKKEDKGKKDTVSTTIDKHSSDTKSGKKGIKEGARAKDSIWKFWKRKETVSYNLIPERLNEAEDSTVLGDETTGSPSVRQISLISLEDEPFISRKRVQTPAKIVHERFKIDED
ncbi:DC-STAMP domain-containing protein 2 [Halyomorpha halys]|uniref:DC-STAMP domain-containing protein 2 n=1 Tax=Halyomorpha halys TaxID=286706 RepID=UPI0006D52222|nr:DC-STAMP domain-containing protein 2-like [Halyomorpha halys]